MEIKNNITGVKNFEMVSNGIIFDALEFSSKEGAVLYSKFTENGDCLFISGNIGVMLCAIADIILMMSKKTGVKSYTLLRVIDHIIDIEVTHNED